MSPVAIFRHAATEGPGYFATYLSRHGIPWQVVRIDAGEAVPEDPRRYGGMAFMGGPMSVNDSLPWIPAVIGLIRAGADAGVPVIGHCLGGQLMAKAFGGEVTRSAVREIGWGRVDVLDDPVAGEWFGAAPASFVSFHWHGETFSIPPGATRIASSPYCGNQAFALDGHLGLQCHVEMTGELIDAWCRSGEREIANSRSPAVQPVEEIRRDVAQRLASLRAVADRLYGRWIKGLRD